MLFLFSFALRSKQFSTPPEKLARVAAEFKALRSTEYILTALQASLLPFSLNPTYGLTAPRGY